MNKEKLALMTSSQLSPQGRNKWVQRMSNYNASMDDDILIGPEMEARFLYELLQ